MTTNSLQTVTVPNPAEGGWTLDSMVISTNTSVATNSVASSLTDNVITIPANNYGNVEITADWEANTYSVTFNTNGGTYVELVNYNTSDSAQNVTVPTKSRS